MAPNCLGDLKIWWPGTFGAWGRGTQICQFSKS